MGDNEHISHDEFVRRQSQRALAIATAILEQQMGPTAGSRLLVTYRGTLGLPDDEEFRLLKVFIGLDSQTDHLPLGAERNVWAPESVKRADAEIARYDALADSEVRAACRQLVEVLTPLVPDLVGELDVVETLDDIVDECYIPRGSRGTVVHVQTEPDLAYLVEFCNGDGSALAMPTLLPHQVRVVWKAPSR